MVNEILNELIKFISPVRYFFLHPLKNNYYWVDYNKLENSEKEKINYFSNYDSEGIFYLLKQMMSELEQISDKLDIPLLQTSEERIIQTLNSKKHIMSMLQDYKNNRSLEFSCMYDSFKLISDILGLDIPLIDNLNHLIRLKEKVSKI